MSAQKHLTALISFLAFSLMCLLPGVAFAVEQQNVSLTPASSSHLLGGDDLALTAEYSADSGAKTGIGVRIHYKSSVLTWTSFSNVLTTPLAPTTISTSPQNDSLDRDDDPETDKFVVVAWSDTSGSWPGSTSATMFNINFSPTGKGTSPVNISFSSTHSFQPAEANNATVDVGAVPSQLAVTSTALSQAAGVKGTMTIQLRDSEGDPAAATSDVLVSLTSNSSGGHFTIQAVRVK